MNNDAGNAESKAEHDQDDWSVAKQIFVEALDVAADQRTAFVRSRLTDDSMTERQVRLLLEAHGRTDGFMMEPKRVVPRAAAIQERIGPYRLIERLGEGGFGVVYRAEQTGAIERQVALKVLKPGLDTSEMVSRFADERRYLAKLDHADIVKVFDAGVDESGRAFIAMELAEGEPISAFAERISLREKVRLMARVAHAVHAVHQRGIIHRDLKPTNILVNDDSSAPGPRVRIIDFGIAAAAERADRAGMTIVGTPLGTPKYASPEQTRGDAGVDTRSDVYALGMILCEVLTGKLPRVVGSTEDSAVRSPSRLSPEDRAVLRGDLDRIVLKAIAWDPDARYGSAGALAEDLERYLAGRPVSATRPSVAYTAGKFVARHRAASVLIGLSMIAMVAGVASLVVGLDRAQRASQETRVALDRVTAERDRADAISTFLLSDVIGTLNPSITGQPTPRTEDLLATMSSLAGDAFADSPATAAEVLRQIGSAQRSISEFGPASESLIRAAEASALAYGPHDARTLDLRVDAVLGRLSAGDIEGAAGEIRDVLRLAREHLGTAHAVTLRAVLHASHAAPDAVAGEDIADLPNQIETRGLAGTPLHIEALEFVGAGLWLERDPRGLEMLVRAEELASGLFGPTDLRAVELRFRAGRALIEAQDLDRAERILSIALDETHRMYGPHSHAALRLLMMLTLAAYLDGRNEDGLARARRLYGAASAPEANWPVMTASAARQVARGKQLVGRFSEAAEWRRITIEHGIDAGVPDRRVYEDRARLVRALALAGAIDEAQLELQTMRAPEMPFNGYRVFAVLALADALVAAGRSDEAKRLVQVELDEPAYPERFRQSYRRWLSGGSTQGLPADSLDDPNDQQFRLP